MLFGELGRDASLRGAELLVVAANWLDLGNLERLGEVLPVARAVEGQCHVVFANGVGEMEVRGRNWSLYGKSRIVSALGEVIATAGPGAETLVATLPGAHLHPPSDTFPLLPYPPPPLYRH